MAEKKKIKSTLKYTEPSNYFPKDVRDMFKSKKKVTSKKKRGG